jgi:hypothetical protein
MLDINNFKFLSLKTIKAIKIFSYHPMPTLTQRDCSYNRIDCFILWCVQED